MSALGKEKDPGQKIQRSQYDTGGNRIGGMVGGKRYGTLADRRQVGGRGPGIHKVNAGGGLGVRSRADMIANSPKPSSTATSSTSMSGGGGGGAKKQRYPAGSSLNYLRSNKERIKRISDSALWQKGGDKGAVAAHRKGQAEKAARKKERQDIRTGMMKADLRSKQLDNKAKAAGVKTMTAASASAAKAPQPAQEDKRVKLKQPSTMSVPATAGQPTTTAGEKASLIQGKAAKRGFTPAGASGSASAAGGSSVPPAAPSQKRNAQDAQEKALGALGVGTAEARKKLNQEAREDVTAQKKAPAPQPERKPDATTAQQPQPVTDAEIAKVSPMARQPEAETKKTDDQPVAPRGQSGPKPILPETMKAAGLPENTLNKISEAGEKTRSAIKTGVKSALKSTPWVRSAGITKAFLDETGKTNTKRPAKGSTESQPPQRKKPAQRPDRGQWEAAAEATGRAAGRAVDAAARVSKATNTKRPPKGSTESQPPRRKKPAQRPPKPKVEQPQITKRASKQNSQSEAPQRKQPRKQRTPLPGG